MHQSTAPWQLEGRSILVSHLERRYWPTSGVTKGDLLRSYRSVAPVLLPYLQDRPVTLRLFPDGVQGFSTSRLTPPQQALAWLRSVSYRPKTAAHMIPLLLIDDAARLLWLANQGCVEFYAWGRGCLIARRLGDLFAPVRQAGQHLPPMAQSSLHLEGDGPVSHDATSAAEESWKDTRP